MMTCRNSRIYFFLECEKSVEPSEISMASRNFLCILMKQTPPRRTGKLNQFYLNRRIKKKKKMEENPSFPEVFGRVHVSDR